MLLTPNRKGVIMSNGIYCLSVGFFLSFLAFLTKQTGYGWLILALGGFSAGICWAINDALEKANNKLNQTINDTVKQLMNR
ncbi:hypothetical protein ACFLZ9_01655 [Patescibacteria group bacterium]